MHALVATVLLRVAGLDAFDRNPEPEPPDREFGEVEEGIRTSKGNAIIGANGLWHSFAGSGQRAAEASGSDVPESNISPADFRELGFAGSRLP